MCTTSEADAVKDKRMPLQLTHRHKWLFIRRARECMYWAA